MASKANTPYSYTLIAGPKRHVAGVPVVALTVHDRYSKLVRHRIERRMVRAFTNFLQWYLKRFPAMEFSSRNNLSRYLTYLPSGMRAWRAYMPGGIATYHAYSPSHKRMPNGKTLDVITRSFFRHTYDAVGLRSRSHIMAWAVRPTIAAARGSIHWLSIGGGSGQPVFDAIAEHPTEVQRRLSLTIVDINPAMLDFARQLVDSQKLAVKDIQCKQADMTSSQERQALLTHQPTVVDAMGLFEYLTPQQCIALLAEIYERLPKGGVLVFTNMSPRHPHLHVHQRALGWPGVIQRTMHEVVALMNKASIPPESQTVYHDQDGVYNVYKVVKQ